MLKEFIIMKFTNLNKGETMKKMFFGLLLMAAVFAQGMNFAGFNNYKLSTAPGTGVNPPLGNISIWWTVTDSTLTMHWRDSAGADHTFSSGGGNLSDAPSDSKVYARKNAGWVEVVSNGSEYSVTVLGTFGIQTIDRAVSDKFILTPSAASTLATSNFGDQQKATLKIIDGGTNISFPTTLIWDIPRILDITSSFNYNYYTYETIITKESVPPVLQQYGFDLFEFTGITYNNSTKILVKHLSSFFDESRVPASLILYFNGDDSSTVFTDSSTTPKTVTAVGGGKLDVSQYHSGSTSLLCGTSAPESYASVEDSTDFDPGSGNFTFHSWIRPSDVSSRKGIFFPAEDTGFGIELMYDKIAVWASSGSGWDIITSDSSEGKSNASISVNVWTHIAITRSNGTFYIFINGVLDKTIVKAGTIVPVRNARHIGQAPSRGPFAGHIDDVIWIKGAASWTANFDTNNL